MPKTEPIEQRNGTDIIAESSRIELHEGKNR
jgi:hypothetical protein